MSWLYISSALDFKTDIETMHQPITWMHPTPQTNTYAYTYGTIANKNLRLKLVPLWVALELELQIYLT